MKALLPLALMVAPAAASAKTLVSFTQSGGIAGIEDSVTVLTTGHVVGDEHGADRSHRLRAATLRDLRTMLSEARWGRADPGASRCADCFEYVVRC